VDRKSNIMIAIEEKRKPGDKRKLKRFSERLKISFNVHGMVYRGLSSNFSLHGLFIRTNHSFPPDTQMEIIIYLPNDLTSHLKGKVVRASDDTLWGVSGKARGYEEKGMGIEIMQKDTLYLHFIRSFLSLEGRHIFEQLVFAEQGEKYQKIKSELQERCHLFDVITIIIGEQSNQDSFKGKAWFEAKIKNNTDYVFMQPIVIFMTTRDTEHAENEKGNIPPEIGTMLMSSSDNFSHWKPGETILLDGEIDLSSEDVSSYELQFVDYLTKTPKFAVDVPISINDYISTLWIGSPYLDERGYRTK
jgi:PilZ domain